MTANQPWVLVVDPPRGNARRRVGGVELVLRLALDAQAGGARAVVVAEAPELRDALADARLQVPVLDEAPPDVLRVRAPATLLAHRSLFKALAERGEDGDLDLSRERLPMAAPFGFEAIDVVDDASARRAEDALFRSLRKPADGWTARWLNRYVSLALSRRLVRTPIRPNQVSIAILGIGIAAAALAARGTYGSLLAGAVLFQAQSVLDGCDGEMARVTYRTSLAGQWLDTIGDDVTNYGFFGAAAFGLHATTAHTAYLAAGASTVLCGVVVSAFEYRYLVRVGSGDLLDYPLSRSTTEGRGPLAAVQPLFKRDTFVLLTLVAAALGLVGPMLIVFALAALGILAGVIGTELRMARERKAAR